MPARSTPLVTNQIYHVLNRGNAATSIFRTAREHQKFIEIFKYYQNTSPPLRFSKFNELNIQERNQILKSLKKAENFLVEIIAFCLMPNHFHLLLKQIQDNGILNFIRLVTNSYSRYFGIKYQRKGSLFEGRFKATRIETDEQLLHVSRYIHLNPYSSYLVKDFEELLKYPFSSLPEYLGNVSEDICHKEIVLGHFRDLASYKDFIWDQADYQRTLEEIKHQILEDLPGVPA